MNAQTLNCPSCGAAVSSDTPHCLYCRARLATVACPSCFGLMFRGSRHCQHCGARAERVEDETTSRQCPRCRVALGRVALGMATLHDCPRCAGLWLTKDSFEQICADREQQAAVLGFGSATLQSVAPQQVSYVPCPDCGQLMNRANFARCSGVVVDVCRRHGTWFDRDELRQIVEFIRSGGVDHARQRELEKIREERRALDLEKAINARRESWQTRHPERASGISDLADSLIRFLSD